MPVGLSDRVPRAPSVALSLVVIGLGRIGSLYDRPRTGVPRSHIGAAIADGSWAIAGLVDPSESAVNAALELWPEAAGAATGSSVADAGLLSADVVAICTPPHDRRGDIEQALSLSPRLIILEKPMATEAAIAVELATRCQEAGVPLIINFHRRFDPGHVRLRQMIPGPVQKAVLRYGKGLWNYGSHLIDLLTDWGGPVSKVRALDIVEANDPMLSFQCTLESGGVAYVLAMPGLEYDQFEADFFFHSARITLENGGVERRLWKPVSDLYYPGYTQLHTDASRSETSRVEGLSQLYASVAAHLLQGEPLQGCTGAEGARSMLVLEAALQSWQAGQTQVPVPCLVPSR